MFSFNHVSISVLDLEKTLKFYELFGFKKCKEYHDENIDIVMIKLENVMIEIFHYYDNGDMPEHAKSLKTDLRVIGNKHFALGVKDINEAKKFVEDKNLNDSDIVINSGRLGKPYFFIKDPNGILMEIIEE